MQLVMDGVGSNQMQFSDALRYDWDVACAAVGKLKLKNHRVHKYMKKKKKAVSFRFSLICIYNMKTCRFMCIRTSVHAHY